MSRPVAPRVNTARRPPTRGTPVVASTSVSPRVTSVVVQTPVSPRVPARPGRRSPRVAFETTASEPMETEGPADPEAGLSFGENTRQRDQPVSPNVPTGRANVNENRANPPRTPTRPVRKRLEPRVPNATLPHGQDLDNPDAWDNQEDAQESQEGDALMREAEEASAGAEREEGLFTLEEYNTIDGLLQRDLEPIRQKLGNYRGAKTQLKNLYWRQYQAQTRMANQTRQSPARAVKEDKNRELIGSIMLPTSAELQTILNRSDRRFPNDVARLNPAERAVQLNITELATLGAPSLNPDLFSANRTNTNKNNQGQKYSGEIQKAIAVSLGLKTANSSKETVYCLIQDYLKTTVNQEPR